MILLGSGIALLVSTIWFYYWMTKDYNYWKKQDAPHINPIFPFGNVTDMVLMRQTAGEVYRDIYRKFNEFPAVGFHKLRKPSLLLRDPELIRTVMVKEFQNFPDNDFQIAKEVDPLLADNPFAIHGSRWKEVRSIQIPSQTWSKIKLMVPEMRNCCNRMVEYIEQNQAQVLEAKRIAGFYTSDSVVINAFGLKSNSFSNTDPGFGAVTNGEMFGSTYSANLAVLCAMLAPAIGKLLKLRILQKDVQDYFVDVINDVADYRVKNCIKRNDFLQQLIDTNENSLNGTPVYNRVEMAAHCMTFFLDGYETSSILLSFILYELASHPQIQNEVRQEILTFSNDINSFDITAIQSLKKLDNVLSETLRLHPPIQSVSRICKTDTTLAAGQQVYRIKKGMSVVIPIYALHTDPEKYQEPNLFDPNRFNNQSTINKFTFLPFGIGPRMCVGVRFVNVQIKLAVISVLLKFHIRLSETHKGTLKLDPKSTFLHTSKGGLWLRFEDYVRS